MRTNLKTDIAHFPTQSGVYIMKNTSGEALYIGKAKNLRARLKSYFSLKTTVKTKALMSHTVCIDYVVTENEYEALLLENNLIKQHSPRYNIELKDAKSYPVIRITNDKYPRVFTTRRIIRDGSLYFGPFTNVWQIKTYLELIDKLFPLRKCRTSTLKHKKKPLFILSHWSLCRCLCRKDKLQRIYAPSTRSTKTPIWQYRRI